MDKIILTECVGFHWDAGNDNKNQDKHDVSRFECEQVFFNELLLTYEDTRHSQSEQRHYALGKTDANRAIFIVFTIRRQLIRVISARDMSKKERRIYHEQS